MIFFKENIKKVLVFIINSPPCGAYLKIMKLQLKFICKFINKNEKIKFLLEFDNFLYGLEGRASVEYGDGVHSKHRHMKYHDFFVDNIKKDDNVLDIGCGYGALAHSIATKSNCKKIYAIDINQSNIEKAKSKFTHDKVEFIYGDATKAKFDDKFDVVVLSNVLEHLKDRSEFLKSIKNNVNPDRFLIRVPMYERDWRVPLKDELGIDYRLDKTHEIEYTTEIFETEIKDAGLIIQSTIYKWGELWAVVM